MPITEEEEKSIREKVRKELEEKEREKLEAFERDRKANEEEDIELREKDQKRKDDLNRLEIAEDEKKKYYKEKGYIPVFDGSGNLVWFSPAEYESKKDRIKSRSSKKKREEEEEIASNKETEQILNSQSSKSTKYIFIGLVILFLIAILLTVIAQFFYKT